jgi:hypothetical protein
MSRPSELMLLSCNVMFDIRISLLILKTSLGEIKGQIVNIIDKEACLTLLS